MCVKDRNPEKRSKDWKDHSKAGLPPGRVTVRWGRVDTAEPGPHLTPSMVPRGSKWIALKESILDLCLPFILFVFRLRVSNYLLLIRKPQSNQNLYKASETTRKLKEKA